MTVYSIPPLLTLVGFVALAVLTLARWRRSRVNLLFLLICVLCAGLYADILFIFNAPSAAAALRVSRLDQFFSLFLIPLYVHFFHAYLGIRNRRWLVALFYAVPGVLIWFGMTPLLIAAMHHYPFGYFGQAGKLYPLVAVPAVGATLYGGWILAAAIAKSTDRGLTRRLKYLFAGFVSIAVLTGLNFIPLYGYPLYPPGNFCFIPLLIFAVGLFRHDLLNMGLLIKAGLVYSALTAALTGIYAVVVVTVNGFLGAAGFSSTVTVHLILFVLIAFIFGPLKTAIRKGVDRAFNDSSAANVSRAIENLEDVSQNLRVLARTTNETFQDLQDDVSRATQDIGAAASVARSSLERADELLASGQWDSILNNVSAGSRDLRRIAGAVGESSEEMEDVFLRADSVLTRMDRIGARIESGEGVLGQLLSDSLLVPQATNVLMQLDLLLADLRENPKRYVRLSIF